MPELPEVETTRRGLEPAMAGKILRKITLRRKDLRVPFPENLARIIERRPVIRLTRRAKYIWVHIGGGTEDILIIHLGMSGRMTVLKDVEGYKPKTHDHMIITMEDGEGVVFNDARRFGMVMLSSADSIQSHAAFRSLGPEPLEKDFTGKILHQRLKGKATPIKLALLDQSVVAGVGNIYASEALYEAGISPVRKAGDIPAQKTELLVKAIKNVLNSAIAAGGSTLKDFRHADGNLGYFQHSFTVYDREGQACPRCLTGAKRKSIIQKIVQSGRATYYCPRCQK